MSLAAAILITGANRGLGFEFAHQYLTEGWRVIAACRNPAAASNLRRLEQNAEGRLDGSTTSGSAALALSPRLPSGRCRANGTSVPLQYIIIHIYRFPSRNTLPTVHRCVYL